MIHAGAGDKNSIEEIRDRIARHFDELDPIGMAANDEALAAIRESLRDGEGEP
jgi:hypothetical protein